MYLSVLLPETERSKKCILTIIRISNRFNPHELLYFYTSIEILISSQLHYLNESPLNQHVPHLTSPSLTDPETPSKHPPPPPSQAHTPNDPTPSHYPPPASQHHLQRHII